MRSRGFVRVGVVAAVGLAVGAGVVGVRRAGAVVGREGVGARDDEGNKMCPVMTEEEVDPDKFTMYKGKRVFFCCDKCKAKFETDPERYVGNLPQFAAASEAGGKKDAAGAGALGGGAGARDAGPARKAPVDADVVKRSEHVEAAAGAEMGADEKMLAAVLFAPDEEAAMVARRALRLRLVPRPAYPPEVGGPAFNEIDRFVVAKWKEAGLDEAKSAPEVCDDATFVRRVYLDVIGVVPPRAEALKFVADTDPAKREKLVDALLARDEDYAADWTPFWEDALGSTDVNNQGGVPNRGSYRQWIYESFKKNKQFDVFAAELIDPTMPGRKPTEVSEANGKQTRTGYVLNYDHVSTLQTAANVAQVFMGTGMKCASCHSHFENPEWPQSRFLAYAGLFSGHDLELIRCEKKLGQTVPAKFCFDLPGMPGDVPATEDGRLRRAAQLLTDPTNPRFARAIVNRLWKRYLGLGLFEPVDDFRLDRPASHPELLEWLAYDFMSHGYDVKHTMRLILTSRTYQLRYEPRLEDHFEVSNPTEARWFRSPGLRRLTAEELVDSVRLATTGALSSKDRLFRNTASTALTRALGKPASRNEISTGRPDDVAVVQALELLNGDELAGMVYGAPVLTELAGLAERDSGAAVDALYWATLARGATEKEREVAVGYVKEAAAKAGAATRRETEAVFLDDEVPAGAETSGEWEWILPDQGPVFSGARAHVARAGKMQVQHYCLGGGDGVKVGARDTLFVYAYLDPADPPREIMVQWNDGVMGSDGGWAHRAYWGENAIGYGMDGTASRRAMGELPKAGGWVRLEVPAGVAGFGGPGGARIVGMSFDQVGGTVYWDKAGVVERSEDPTATALGDVLWSIVTGPEFQYVK